MTASWFEGKRFKMSWAELTRIEQGWAELSWADLSHARWAEPSQAQPKTGQNIPNLALVSWNCLKLFGIIPNCFKLSQIVSNRTETDKIPAVHSPSLIPALWNIGILLHKQATHLKHFWPKCSNKLLYACIGFFKVIYSLLSD